jgi:hypothetical protein
VGKLVGCELGIDSCDRVKSWDRERGRRFGPEGDGLMANNGIDMYLKSSLIIKFERDFHAAKIRN